VLLQGRIRGSEKQFDFYMRTMEMEYAQGSYIHEKVFIGLHVSMWNAKSNSNGRRDRNVPITMIIFHREV
jgi:hypothetical protein